MNAQPSEKKPSDLATYSSLFYRLLDPTFLLSWEELIIVEVNDSCEMVLGIPTAQVLGTKLSDWLLPESAAECDKFLRMSKRKYYPYQFDLFFKTAENRVIITKAAACALSLTNQEQIVQVIIKDITSQFLAEKAAKETLEQLKLLNEKLTQLSTTDELTQLTNVREFKKQLEAEHLRAQRYQSVYALIFMDVDNFKHYNDTNGHPAGDRLLQHLSQVIKTCVRLSDLAARYGGEEFIVLCPAVSAYQAYTLAERIRSTVCSVPFENAAKQPLGYISVSIGIAGFPEHGSTPDQILKSADDSLYLSKKAGRNRITVPKPLGT